jgi:uncharacterized delta-60 repeat protein
MFVFRYTSDGALDSTFSGDGELFTTEGGFGSQASSVVVQSTGRIVVGGLSQESGGVQLALRGVQNDGTLDPTFGDSGSTLTTTPGTPYINALALTPDDRIVAVGTAGAADNHPAFLVARYSASGTLDAGFGSGGLVITEPSSSSNSQLEAVAIQADGKIVAGGFVEPGARLVRYRANGTLDPLFGGGTGMTGVVDNGNWRGIALQSDGNIVAVGGPNNDFNVARYQAGLAIAPGAPTGVVAAAGDGEVSVSWSGAGEGGAPVTGYTVTSSPDGITLSVPGDTTTASVPGLANDVAYTFTVTATNEIGTGPSSDPSNSVTPRSGAAIPGTISGTVDSFSPSVTTDPDASGPSPAEPVTTGVTAPANVTSGTITIRTATITEPYPATYSFVGREVSISAAVTPAPTANEPMTIVFGLDPSALGSLTADSVHLFRAEGSGPTVEVPDCTGAPGVAAPDPCISTRATRPDGGAVLTALTSSASTWDAAVSDTAPHITSLSRASGTVGQAVTISGSGFHGATAVHFGGVNQPAFKILSDTQIKAKVPVAAITGPITVAKPSGTAASTSFGVKPKIASFTPSSGARGSQVTITGTGFAGMTSVKFRRVSATFTINSPTQVTATVPGRAQTGPITVATAGGNAKTTSNFTVT